MMRGRDSRWRPAFFSSHCRTMQNTQPELSHPQQVQTVGDTSHPHQMQLVTYLIRDKYSWGHISSTTSTVEDTSQTQPVKLGTHLIHDKYSWGDISSTTSTVGDTSHPQKSIVGDTSHPQQVQQQVRGVLGNKCAGQHNLKTVHFRDTLASGNFLAWSSEVCLFFSSALSTLGRRQ